MNIEQLGAARTDQPMVSVAIITYKHEKFIAQALESVFSQIAPFSVEVVIGEDCSPDGTLDKIRRVCLGAQFPTKLLTSESNVGMHANFRRVLAACTGKYIALLEGDDWWTSPQKLALQVQALENRPSCPLCYHQVICISEAAMQIEGRMFGDQPLPAEALAATTFPQLLSNLGQFFRGPSAASVMFVRQAFPTLPEWVDELPWCDWPIWLTLLKQGDAIFLPTPLAVYRQHDNQRGAI
jgi:glycosyltransferase involved in cell wall biosynthesis